MMTAVWLYRFLVCGLFAAYFTTSSSRKSLVFSSSPSPKRRSKCSPASLERKARRRLAKQQQLHPVTFSISSYQEKPLDNSAIPQL
ncbi:hypothetical protein BASA81_008099 [Batrachochytrium salamandrivorans]|nr:hypothetical protein BASA81_008099 [Batrachochytrium salamandrivorans]